MKTEMIEITETNEPPKKSLKLKIGLIVAGLLLLAGVGTCIGLKMNSTKIENFTVAGNSMSPTLEDGATIKVNTDDKDVDRFDVVLLNFNDTKYVKRIVGLPNEKVEYIDNVLYINGEKVDDPYNNGTTSDFSIELGDNDIYVLGDNRSYSKDSRKLGRFKLGYIIGTVE